MPLQMLLLVAAARAQAPARSLRACSGADRGPELAGLPSYDCAMVLRLGHAVDDLNAQV